MISCLFGLHLATYHFNRNAVFNELNPGVYTYCGGWVAGTYRNSERGHSQYLGRTFAIGPVELVAGIVNGYVRGPLPLLLPSYKLSQNVRLTLLPPIPKATTNTAGLHVSIEW